MQRYLVMYPQYGLDRDTIISAPALTTTPPTGRRTIISYFIEEEHMKKFIQILPTILFVIFEAAVGTLLLIDGEKLTWLIFIVFGSILLIIGIISLIMALVKGKKTGVIGTGQLVLSVLMIAFGGFLTAASGSVREVVSSIALIYGLILIIGGVLKLADYLAYKGATGVGNGFVVFSAVLSILFGMIIAFNPFGTATVIWTIMGIAVLASAVLDIISLIVYAVISSKQKNTESEK